MEITAIMLKDTLFKYRMIKHVSFICIYRHN